MVNAQVKRSIPSPSERSSSVHFFLIFRSLFSQAKVLDHSRTPCEDSVEFVPDSTGETYVFYLRMDTARDLTTWSNVARCFVMSDLNVGGNHNSMWRFWIKKNHILAVGCPASTYCVYKPKDVTPLDLPG